MEISILQGPNIILDLKAAQALNDRLNKDVEGFLKLAQLLKKLSGIYLHKSEYNLNQMANYLSLKMISLNLNTYKEYEVYIFQNRPQSENEFVQLMTINTTHFFREPEHYRILKEYLPQILKNKIDRNDTELKVWCSAASTGQEPYSILITLLETFPDIENRNLTFYATDIDQSVLLKADLAEYNESEISSLPMIYRLKYFDLISKQNKIIYSLKEPFRNWIRFRKLNLLDQSNFIKNSFDIIFCRNVLIYFQNENRNQVFNKLISNLAPNGLLFLSHSEGGLLKNSQLRSIGPAVYLKSDKK